MSTRKPGETAALVVRSRMALGLTQKELGAMFGMSSRTAHRWEGGASFPGVQELRRLACEVESRDPELAAQLAAHTGTTLDALRVAAAPVATHEAPVAVEVVPVATREFPPVGLLIDSILVAAVDAAEDVGVPAMARPALRAILGAAFGRARALGLTVEEVDEALGWAAPAKAPLSRA
jgi:transcriptional regulator with XRE-family HTH domain